jgi:MFS family permease
MAVQLTNMVGSTLSDRVKARFGEGRVLYTAPMVIFSSLILLAALQVLPALLLIAVMGFLTAVVRPLLLSRVQDEIPDDIRATILSMQSLMFTGLAAISQPIMGYIADQSGLPAAYVALAGSLSILLLFLFWKSRHHFPTVSGRIRLGVSTRPQLAMAHANPVTCNDDTFQHSTTMS